MSRFLGEGLVILVWINELFEIRIVVVGLWHQHLEGLRQENVLRFDFANGSEWRGSRDLALLLGGLLAAALVTALDIGVMAS